MKRKVVELVKESIVTMGEMKTKVDFKILPFGSYYLLISMDSLEKHSVVVNCQNKTFDSLD
jgi:hypothetical protein